MKKTTRIFKTRKEEKAWIHEHMLTVKKLIDWLQKQDPDALVYRFETNTGDWQEIPGDIDTDNSPWFETVQKAKQRDRKFYKSMYQNSKNADAKITAHLKAAYKYTEPNGIIIRL